ncbi:MAG: type IV secretion system protein [Hydrogenophaga sp.]|nr:type IV secretion system protein [Hydrogenophaga sp.]
MPAACSAAGVLTAGAAFGISGGADLLTVLQDAFFYCSVRSYIMDDIIQGPYRELVAQKLAIALGMLSTTIMTIWVAYQGFQIITGANRNPIVPLFIQTGKMALILALVSLVAANSPVIVDSVTDFKTLISEAVANGTDITDLIDLNLGITSLLNSITESMKALDNGKDPNSITTTVGLIGQSGPAMLTAVLLMLTELSVTFAIMLSPLFIFFLLFQQTQALFWSWAKFLLGALFSLATLTLIGALVLKATAVYGGSVVMAYYGTNALGVDLFDISGSALRLAALGTLMSAILMAIPHTIMQFFSAGAGFAAGAFGFAGAGALAGSLGAAKGLGSAGLSALGQSQVPQVGSSAGGQSGGVGQGGEAPGQTGGARALQQADMAGITSNSGYNAQSAIGRFNSEAVEQSGGQRGLQGMSGTRGLANQSSALQDMAFIQQKQASHEFRDGGTDAGAGAGANANTYSATRASQASSSVQDMNYDAAKGVYVTESTQAALNGSAGKGGSLPVSGGVSDTSSHQGDRVATASARPGEAPPLRYGRGTPTRAG